MGFSVYTVYIVEFNYSPEKADSKLTYWTFIVRGIYV